MFELTAIQFRSGNSIPTFSDVLGDFTNDNEIIWACKDKIESDPAWSSNHIYELGNSIKNGSFSYECVGFRGTSDITLPNFKQTDNFAILNSDIATRKFTVSGDVTDFFSIHDTVRVLGSNGNDGYYTVSYSTYNGSTSDIVVVEDGIS